MFHFVFAFMTKRESKLLFFLKSRTKILSKKKTHEVKFYWDSFQLPAMLFSGNERQAGSVDIFIGC